MDERIPGPIEQTVLDELDWIRESNPDVNWSATLEGLALKLAQAIDDLPPTDQFRLSPMIGKLTDLMDRLAATPAADEQKPKFDFESLLNPE